MTARPSQILTLVVVLLLGCGPSHGGDLLMSSKSRLSASDVPAADIQAQVADDSTFAFALYHQLAEMPGNVFFSPYSISSTLAMTWAGAAGDTATGMASALSFSMPAAHVHSAFNALDAALASRANDGGSGADGGPFQLHVTNALWTQKGTAIEPAFLDTLAENYGAGVREEDFAKNPTAAVADINAWFSDETSGHIADVLDPSDVSSLKTLVLTNAVYFDAGWAQPFAAAATTQAPFHALDGSAPTVALMRGAVDMGYAAGDGWAAVDLPYSNPDVVMTVIVPAEGRFAEIEAKLAPDFLKQLVSAETLHRVDLGFPSFEVTTRADLGGPLAALGMQAALSPGLADFSGIDGERDLYLKKIVHEATLQVDETGTVAAAATSVGFVPYVSPPIAKLTVDRPFFIALRDVPTGSLLFLGRIVQP